MLTKVPIIQEQQQSYEAPPQQNRFGNQQYNGKNWHGQHNFKNHYNQCGYNQNNGFRQISIKCFCCHKGHVKKDCPIWKKVMEEEEKKSRPKVGVNFAMIDQDQPILDVFVTTKGQKACMLEEEIQEKELNPTKGWRTKLGQEKNVLQDVIREL